MQDRESEIQLIDIFNLNNFIHRLNLSEVLQKNKDLCLFLPGVIYEGLSGSKYQLNEVLKRDSANTSLYLTHDSSIHTEALLELANLPALKIENALQLRRKETVTLKSNGSIGLESNARVIFKIDSSVFDSKSENYFLSLFFYRLLNQGTPSIFMGAGSYPFSMPGKVSGQPACRSFALTLARQSKLMLKYHGAAECDYVSADYVIAADTVSADKAFVVDGIQFTWAKTYRYYPNTQVGFQLQHHERRIMMTHYHVGMFKAHCGLLKKCVKVSDLDMLSPLYLKKPKEKECSLTYPQKGELRLNTLLSHLDAYGVLLTVSERLTLCISFLNALKQIHQVQTVLRYAYLNNILLDDKLRVYFLNFSHVQDKGNEGFSEDYLSAYHFLLHIFDCIPNATAQLQLRHHRFFVDDRAHLLIHPVTEKRFTLKDKFDIFQPLLSLFAAKQSFKILHAPIYKHLSLKDKITLSQTIESLNTASAHSDNETLLDDVIQKLESLSCFNPDDVRSLKEMVPWLDRYTVPDDLQEDTAVNDSLLASPSPGPK